MTPSAAPERYPVVNRIREDAHISGEDAYQKLYQRSVAEPTRFWEEMAGRLDWFRSWDRVLDWDFHRAEIAWFSGGKLNVSTNCIDRHLTERGDQVAIIWEADEPGEGRKITYRELHHEVGRIANLLKAQGVVKGDRVILYLPMIPELAFFMLACARIGAVHSVVFAGFSADSVRDRVLDCGANLLVTADEGLRGGKRIPLKQIVDQALDGLQEIERVLVVKRTGAAIDMKQGRDLWVAEEAANHRAMCPAEWMDSEDPLFILYTSGSTGKPKGVLHTTGGYLLYASYTHEHVFDYHPGDIYFCAADIGWITGHSYIVYGPLANGATTVMFESTPLYPNPGRYWDVVARHKVTIFYTAPTAIRAIAREGDDWVSQHDTSSLRVLGTVGEPINPEAWVWYYEVVGASNCALVDTWWQTETGGIMISPLPGVTELKPGSATRPLPGIQPVLVDEQGGIIEGNDVSGRLCIKFPWPGMARTVYGDHQRFFQTYFQTFAGYYFTGDGCRRDEDGYYWITGRVDDVLNVSGHRLGTAEIESAINAHDAVAESAVVGYPHPIKGTGIFAFVIASKESEEVDDATFRGWIAARVSEDIGKFARPDQVLRCPGLPKTRSGKIMRRILRKIAEGIYDDLGNVTTLADPTVVEALIKGHREMERGT